MQCTLNSHIIWSMPVPCVYVCYHLCPHISYTLIIELQAQSFKKGICVNTSPLEESGFVNYFPFLKYCYYINVNRAGIAQNIYFFSTKTYIKLGEERGTKASLVKIWWNNMSPGLSHTRRTWGKRYCRESHASWTLSFQLAWYHCWALTSYTELGTVSDKCNCWHCCTRYLWKWDILQMWKALAEVKEFQKHGCRMVKKPTTLQFTLLKYSDQTYRKKTNMRIKNVKVLGMWKCWYWGGLERTTANKRASIPLQPPSEQPDQTAITVSPAGLH